jgi:hypothetical protein
MNENRSVGFQPARANWKVRPTFTQEGKMNGVTRWGRWLLFAWAAGAILWGGAAVVYAQPDFAPGQIMVSATRNTTVERVLLVQTAAPVSELRFVSLDLPESGGERVLPARAVQAALPVTELAPNDFFTLTLTIDLRGVASGQYQGEAQVWHENGVVSLPLTVWVKDGWILPLATLLVGIVTAVAVSTYRASGKPRDELLARVGILRGGMGQDETLDQQFHDRIEAALVDAEMALRVEKWDEAQAAVAQAEAIWNRWRKGRADWLAQLGVD